ncbi:MAG: CCDC90 family protein [Thiobacillaceae bacterium]|nr:CCDC90 family protein [Thiobacillaceae bacterium]MDW8324322.1 hypothetical protein [Burkholderiales bacterium]
MATVTFDTHKFVRRLREAGLPESQAEAQREAWSEAMDTHLATKPDIARLELKLVEHDGEFKLIKWMLGLLLAGVLALVLKTFFP